MLLAGFLVSFWGIFQYLGFDLNQVNGFRTSVMSTLGNRLFVPAFLIMCIPINIYFLNRSFNEWRSFRGHTPQIKAQARVGVFFLFNLLCFISNLFIITISKKRGPILGLAAGLFIFVVLYLTGREKRRIALGVLSGGGLLSTLFFWIGLAGHRVTCFAHIPLVNTLAESFHTSSGLVRVYIWKGAVNLLASNPVKWVFGYGPETLPLVLPPHSFSILKQIGRPAAIADRAHNEILDLLVMQGFFGTAAFLAIFGMIGFHVLCHMGLINSRTQKKAWVGFLLAGCFLGSFSTMIISGSRAFSAMGFGIGLVGGFCLYLGWFIITAPHGCLAPWDSKKLLLGVLLFAISAHFIEIQFSFGTTATRLYYWILAGMAIVVSSLDKEKKPIGYDAQQMTRLASPRPLFPAILAVFAILTVSFNFLCFSRQHSPFFWSVLGCHVCTIFLCWSFFRPASTISGGRQCFWHQKDFIFFIVVFGVGGLYYFGYFFIENIITKSLGSFFINSIPAVLQKNVKLSSYYGWILAILFLGPIFILLDRSRHAGVRKIRLMAGLAPLLVLFAIPVAIRSNLYYPMADIYTKAGNEWLGRENWPLAEKCFRNAIALDPDQAWRYLNLGHLFFMHAQKVPEPKKNILYEEALLQAENAVYLAPLDVTLKNNLARMSSAWAAQTANEKKTPISPGDS